MIKKFPPSLSKVCIHTGNVLYLNQLKLKAGQTPTEELLESLRITLADWVPPQEPVSVPVDGTLSIHSKNDCKPTGIEAKDELKIGVKIYITSGKCEALTEAVDNLLATMGSEEIHSLVLAYYEGGGDTDEGVVSEGESAKLKTLMELWAILERTVQEGRVSRIGVSDVDTDVFVSLYANSKVKPSIVQINLSTCCVVPPQLQEFTKQNDVQLLTHNDPQEILPESSLNGVFETVLHEGEAGFRLYWATRFLVHVKCRGVLASKGYLVCVKRTTPA